MRAGQNAVPFPAKTPNDETCEALRQAAQDEDLTEYARLDDLKTAHGRQSADKSRRRDRGRTG